MRKFLLAALFLGVALTTAMAQNGERLKERIRAQRVAIFTDVLSLTSEEATGFWPVYNQFLEDREKVQDELKDIRRDNLNDSEAEAQVKKYLELRQRELDLEKDMVQKMRKVISMQKIGKIPEAEREFRRTVLEKLKERAEDRRGKRGGGK
jgi:hypothetical protein